MPHVTENGLKPATQRARHALEWLQRAVAGSLNQLQKGFPGRLCIFTLEPRPQVLHPVNDFAQLGKAPTPFVTRDQLVHVELIGGLQPAFAQLLEVFGFLWTELFLHRTQDPVQGIDGQLHHMEAIDHVHLLTKELLNGRRVRLGHISHYYFNLITFGLRTALEPGQNILGTSSLEGRNGLASVQVDNQGVIAMPLAPGILINTKGSAKLARAATPTPLKGPAKHRALRETIATGQCAARAA